ncbi:reverse transcriptase domain-containing protein, partial [Tanacetum coccineum]
PWTAEERAESQELAKGDNEPSRQPKLCMKESSFMPTLLIPGLKSLSKNIDVYLRLLIDDLKDLWAKPGVEIIDVATGQKFNMRAMVLWTIMIFPARSSLFKVSSKVTKGIPYNVKKTPSVRVLSKTAYVGHRRFLKKPHKWRRSLKFNGETKNEDPPREFSWDAIMTQLARLPMRAKGKHPRQDKTWKGWAFDVACGSAKIKTGSARSLKLRILSHQRTEKSFVSSSKELNYQIAQSKVINILCNLELIYPPAFFDIMIHLVIHLPLEAIFSGPIRPRWMYPFKRYMKKLKNYVRNKAKPEGSIAEGYVAEEALTFSSHYFRDVTMKFNYPDRNVDCPPPTCQFQVFKSLCKSIGLRSVIRIDHQELKKVIWYVLHNSPEINTYQAKFKSKGTRKPNFGGRRAGGLHTRQETQNLGLKAIIDKNGPVPIRFEFGDRETLMPLGDHAAHWANYLGELVRELSLHYPSWRQMPPERKAGVVAKIGIYNCKKATLKERHWVPDEDGTYNVERIRRGRPSHIFETESSATREYPSLIHTFFLTHTVGGEFFEPWRTKLLYDEMLRLQRLGSNTSTGVPYTEDEIMVIVHCDKQQGHILGVGRVLLGQGMVIPPLPLCTHSFDVAKIKKSEKRLTKQVKMFMKLFRSDDKFSLMFTQLESQPDYGGGSGSGGCRDDELG